MAIDPVCQMSVEALDRARGRHRLDASVVRQEGEERDWGWKKLIAKRMKMAELTATSTQSPYACAVSITSWR